MIRLNDESNYCWDPEDRLMVYDAMAELNEELAHLGLSDEELNQRILDVFKRMRFRQLN